MTIEKGVMFLPLGVSIVFFLLFSIYYIQMAERYYLATYLDSVDSIFAKEYKKARTPAQKDRLSRQFSPVFTRLTRRIEGLYGYWKRMHVTYHVLARVALAQGRTGDAARYLERALDYHPYYANAYDMLGNVWLIMGARDRGRACKAVAKAIYKDLPFDKADMQACRSPKSE